MKCCRVSRMIASAYPLPERPRLRGSITDQPYEGVSDSLSTISPTLRTPFTSVLHLSIPSDFINLDFKVSNTPLPHLCSFASSPRSVRLCIHVSLEVDPVTHPRKIPPTIQRTFWFQPDGFLCFWRMRLRYPLSAKLLPIPAFYFDRFSWRFQMNERLQYTTMRRVLDESNNLLHGVIVFKE